MRLIHDQILPSHCNIPPTNPTRPSEPLSLSATPMPGLVRFSWVEGVTRPYGTAYQLIQANSPGDATLGTVVYDTPSLDALVNVSDPSPRYYWVRAYANSWFSGYYPNTTGLAARALPVDDGTFSQRVLIDEEFQYDVGSNYWFRGSVNAPAVSSYAIVPAQGFSGNGVLRLYSANSVDGQWYLSKRDPPLTARANQIYSWYLRLRRASSVDSGFITVQVTNANSVWIYHPESTGILGVSQVRLDGKHSVTMPFSVAAVASNYFAVQGQCATPNSVHTNFPFLTAFLLAGFRGGNVDIDKFAVWQSNSTALVGTYAVA